MSYIKDDYADEDWDDQNEDDHYEEEAKELSDYDDASDDDIKKLKPKHSSDGEKSEDQDGYKLKHEEDDLESIEDEDQNLMIIDTIPDAKKDELELNDDFEGIEAKPNTERITSPYISKYEKAMVIGKRAQQIGKNSAIYVSLSQDEMKRMNALEIAEREFEIGKIPMLIRRYLPDRSFEDWRLSELKGIAW